MSAHKIEFYKYHGAGNDFIIIDQRDSESLIDWTQSIIGKMCDRRFGIGADGLMLIDGHENLDFTMIYFNSDGRESTMCGNGGRCITALAHQLQIFSGMNCTFMAVDGEHQAKMIDEETVALRMIDVPRIDQIQSDFILHTGSPHYVKFVEDVDSIDVYKSGKSIRESEPFKGEGVNVNFVEEVNGVLKIRTYERGVEDETLACGTGVTAAVLAYADQKMADLSEGSVDVKASGGTLSVSFQKNKQGFKNVWLTGPAKFVFKGTYHL